MKIHKNIWAIGGSLLVLGALLLSIAGLTTPANSQSRNCKSTGPAQFAERITLCASSVLRSQGRNSYGVRQFNNSRGAWCEGVRGNGEGEIISFHLKGASAPYRFHIRNGYIKSDKAFYRNGRVKLLRMSDDAGNSKVIRLRDSKREQVIKVPWDRQRAKWYEFEILEVYRGSRYNDTCISEFWIDWEEMM